MRQAGLQRRLANLAKAPRCGARTRSGSPCRQAMRPEKTMQLRGPKMTDDPMRQAGLQRRLANLAKAPRCGARTRSGSPCRQAAVRGRARCRMHGGAKGSGGPRGARNGNFKHGNCARESLAIRQKAREEIRAVKRILNHLVPLPAVPPEGGAFFFRQGGATSFTKPSTSRSGEDQGA